MAAVDEVAPEVAVATACRALGIPRATYYRHRRRSGTPRLLEPRPERRPQPRALSEAERTRVLQVLHSERFADTAPAEVVATLLDEGTYLASERTMYRIMAGTAEVRERRNQLTHPPYARPELVAAWVDNLWSWDVTKLLGPAKWTYYYLFVMLDVFSRYVVGWMLAPQETAALAERLIAEAITKGGRTPQVVHADRGSSMTSKPVAFLLADLGITKSHSRPHVSNDNPYSEAHFKTLKYRPDFPGRFGSMDEARAFCRRFFHWYNTSHRHAGIGYLTPEAVYFGRANDLYAARASVLQGAYAKHPERFVRRAPRPPDLPGEAWINRPEDRGEVTQ